MVGVDAVAVLGLKVQIRIRILRHRRGVTAALYSSLGFRRCPTLIDGNNRLTARYGEGTALNGQNTLINRISTVTSVDQYRTSALLYTERTALDRGLIPVHHCGLLGIFKDAIHNGQLGPVIILYCIQAAAERTTSDHQLRICMVCPFDMTVAWIFIGIIVISICNHAGETAALAYSYTIIDSHTAVVQNVIIGIFPRSLCVLSSLRAAGVLPTVQHYGTVIIDRGTAMALIVYCAIPLNRQGRTILHCDRIRCIILKSLAVQVEGDRGISGDGDISRHILVQDHIHISASRQVVQAIYIAESAAGDSNFTDRLFVKYQFTNGSIFNKHVPICQKRSICIVVTIFRTPIIYAQPPDGATFNGCRHRFSDRCPSCFPQRSFTCNAGYISIIDCGFDNIAFVIVSSGNGPFRVVCSQLRLLAIDRQLTTVIDNRIGRRHAVDLDIFDCQITIIFDSNL